MKKRIIATILALCIAFAALVAYFFFRPVDCRSSGEEGVVLYNGIRYVRVYDGPSSSVKHGFVKGRTEDGAFLYSVSGADDCIWIASGGRGSIYQREPKK